MTDTHETITDIIAEKRRRADELEASSYRPHQFLRERIAELRQEADRLEAALKRELSKNVSKNGADFGQLGDCAKLREALIKAITMLAVCEWPDGTNMEGVEELMRDIDAALDAPPRNCDVGTEEEQSERFRKFCSSHKYLGSDFSHVCKGFGKGRCPFFNSHTKSQCEFAWAQMPYVKEEGDAK